MYPARNLLMEQRIERGKRPFYKKGALASKGSHLRRDSLHSLMKIAKIAHVCCSERVRHEYTNFICV